MKISSGGNRLAVIGVGALLAAGVFVGCGGSDSGELSKEEFIAQADQICAESNEQTNADQQEFQTLITEGDFEGAADNFDQTSATIDEALTQVEELEAPAEDQTTIDEWTQIGREQLDLAAQFTEAIRAQDAARIESIGAEVDDLSTQSDKIADDYGMVDCGSAGSDS